MHLVSFTVENYRSITSAHKIGTGSTTVLVGPNNEGKSNILRALSIAMTFLTDVDLSQRGRGPIRLAWFRHHAYDWDRDFPLHRRGKGSQSTALTLEFLLTEGEVAQFRAQIGSALNGTLPLRLVLDASHYRIEVAKQGPGAKKLASKSGEIARFVAQRLAFDYVPAVRTADSAERIVRRMVGRELERVEDDPIYLQALAAIEAVQAPILKELSDKIKATLVQFLPAVKHVTVQIAKRERTNALRECEITVDDGTPTELSMKGDGVQSLAALGIMRHASQAGGPHGSSVLAIEEPESHLHPEAIRRLKEVIADLAERHQVVLTTHCPLFVDRANVASNIIVHRKTAKPAESIEQVRRVLGIQAADNLMHAELILVVEGEDDRVALKALLAQESPLLEAAIGENLLAVDSLTGTGKLAYKLSGLRDTLCRFHCFLDNDQAAHQAQTAAEKLGLVSQKNCHFATCPGLKESELEDLYQAAAYSGVLQSSFGIAKDTPKASTKSKWSGRMKQLFAEQGKHWGDAEEMSLKAQVAEWVSKNPDKALHPARRGSFDALVKALEATLSKA